jgi:hypothetical protein
MEFIVCALAALAPELALGADSLSGKEVTVADGDKSWISIMKGDTGPVYVNDKFAGFIDELNNDGGGMPIPSGSYTIRAESKKYGVITRTVTVEANKVTVIPLEKK